MTAPWRYLLHCQPEENLLIETPDERRAAINFTHSPLARQGFSVVVVAGILTLSVGGLAVGPALKKINEWSDGVKLVLEDRLPPLKANKKPLDVPGSTFVTAPGLLSTDSTGSDVGTEYEQIRLVYATTGIMRGEVTARANELTEYLQGADDVPALIRSARPA